MLRQQNLTAAAAYKCPAYLVSVEPESDCLGCGFSTIRGGIRIGITRFSGVSIDCGVNGTRFSGDGVSGIGLGITGYSAENEEGEGYIVIADGMCSLWWRGGG